MPHVSLEWLGRHVSVPSSASIEDIAQSLVRVGIEEEEIIPAAVTGPLVAGLVRSIVTERASNGKDINYCRVDVGEFNDAPGTGAEPSDIPSRGIICGAHNFQVGDTVVAALPGAVLPGPFPISARKTYGHVSDGMICSMRELGLGEDHDGIIVLGRTLEMEPIPAPGTDMIPLLGLGAEVLEVNVTPDRGYCFSMRGLAREYSHSTGADFTDLGLPASLDRPLPASTQGAFEVLVADGSERENRAACDRFVTRIVRGIDPNAKTPAWMVRSLEQAGMRSRSLPVDVTNYVMLDLGQPLHAYDLGFVEAPFVVRRAQSGQKFTTLDGSELTLDSDDIVITDSPHGERAARIVGLAGVMGGLDSEVTENTTDVVVEAAHFDPVSIARTARRHKLSTDASKRFERGVDPLLAAVAAQRAADLIAQYGSGTVDEAGWDLNETQQLPQVFLPAGEVARLTGLDLDPSQIAQTLREVGCTVETTDTGFEVTPASWRPDLVGPAHLVEEVARLVGYDQIPSRLCHAPGGASLTPAQQVRRRATQTLAQNGMVEVKSYPFISTSHDRQGLAVDDVRRQAVRLRNPLADDAPWLRTTILDSLLEIAERNASRGVTPLAMYEFGQVARPQGTVPAPLVSVEGRPGVAELEALFLGVPAQPWHAAGIMGGSFAPLSGPQLDAGLKQALPWDWADAIEAVRMACEANGVHVEATRAWLPGDVTALAANRRKGPPLPALAADPQQVAPWHPARCATLFVRKGKSFVEVGRAGELHPSVVQEFGLPARSVAFELDMDALTVLVSPEFLKVKPVSAYPAAKEDFAVIVPESLPEADVAAVIRRAAGALAESVTLFDIYRGPQVGEQNKSLAYALVLRAADRTLSAKDVEGVRADVIAALEKRLGAKLRS